MSDLSKIILGTGNYYDVKSGNTVSVTGDGGNAWGYFGPAYKKYDLFLIALVNNKYAGHIYGIYVGDLFYFDVIIVKDEYRNKSIATKIIEKTIEILKHNNFKTIVTTVENLNNFENHLIPLLEKYNFEKITNIKGYWGTLYPEVLCNECNSKPCKCVATIYLKKI